MKGVLAIPKVAKSELAFLLTNRTYVRYTRDPTWRAMAATLVPNKERANDEVRRELAAQLATATTTLPGDESAFQVEPGRIVGLLGSLGSGMTRVGLSLLVEPSRVAPVVVVDHRGWFSPLAAWEVGIDPESLYIVRTETSHWTQVMATLLGGVRAVYADVPATVADRDYRRLAGIARRERTAVVLRAEQPLPSGIAHWRITADDIVWEGSDQGHGRIGRRTLSVTVGGKAVAGIERQWEVEDHGTHPVRVVAGLAPSQARRAAG